MSWGSHRTFNANLIARKSVAEKGRERVRKLRERDGGLGGGLGVVRKPYEIVAKIDYFHQEQYL